MRYVVVDDDMLKDKWYPISKGMCECEKEKTLVYKLCNKENVAGLKMVYESGQVKVYEVQK